MADDWQPIETAPKNERILLAAWHGGAYMVVKAKRIGSGWHDTAEDSCVGWRPGHSHKAYWMPLPAPPVA